MINKLILASKSPQRKRILEDMGIRFRSIPSHVDEHHSGLKKPHAIAKSIALRKAETISKKYPNEWVLGCDTFVVLSNSKIAVKPRNKDDARKTINLYRNSHCDVYSGLALINQSLNKKFVQYNKTRLYFRNFSDENIEQYLCSGEWKGCSGSMTIEGRGGKWVKKVEGDYWNVVGLPVELLKEFMNEIEKTVYPIIKGKRVVIRPMTTDEIPLFYKWGTVSDATPYWYGRLSGDKKIPTYKAFVEDWEPCYFDTSKPEGGQCFMVLAEGRPIGQINYNKISKKDRSTELDILIAKKRDMSKGYGSDALKTLMNYLFKNMNIRRCWIKPIVKNPRAIKAYEKAGFKVKKTVKEKGLDHVYMERVRN